MKRFADFFPLVKAFKASGSSAKPAGDGYEIGTWRGFRPAAISYTFDDNLLNQYKVAVPMFNSRGFKITLFTVTTWLPDGSWSVLKDASMAGNEVASHTVTHPRLSEVTPAQQTNELAVSQSEINAHITNATCLTIAYPYCVEAEAAITAKYYAAARGCSGELAPPTPSNFMNISSFICGSKGRVKTPKDFNNLADRAAASNSWCIYVVHAIDDERGYSPLASSTLQTSIDYLSANTDKFWVETFGNVVRYIKERDAAAIREISHEDNRIVLEVTGNLDKTIYNYPITLRRRLPAGWLAAVVSQKNQAVSTQIVSDDSNKYVMFDVVPNGDEIILTKTDGLP